MKSEKRRMKRIRGGMLRVSEGQQEEEEPLLWIPIPLGTGSQPVQIWNHVLTKLKTPLLLGEYGAFGEPGKCIAIE